MPVRRGYEFARHRSVSYTSWVTLECGGLTPLLLVAARRDIGPMSIIAAAIPFRKEMKLSIGGRCQATANESGVKPPHSKGLEPSV